MDEIQIIEQLPGALLPWYRQNRRDLPWRKDKEPYHIWVSEIMLQQTRVEAVKGYYARFLEILPTVSHLALCDDALLHKLWEGLGYYSRVRNLKKAAQQIMEKHGGVFPENYDDVLALPGIGEYTAGAICSIAFGQPTPAVDGNVLRVLARITNDPTPIDTPAFKKTVSDRLAKVYPVEAGNFTQALMELGATVCGPNRKPECEKCPCQSFCRGYRLGTAEDLPVKLPKRGRKTEELTVFILCCDGKFALEKRPDRGLLAGLWQFPNAAGKLSGEEALHAVEGFGVHPKEILAQVERKHVFTHIEWEMCGVFLETADKNKTYTWLSFDEIETEAALPTAFRQFWDLAKDGIFQKILKKSENSI